MSDRSLLSYDTLVLAAAGVAGSVSAQLLTMPLTTCFTRAQLDKQNEGKGPFQILQSIVANEGIQGVYRGCVSTCQCVAVSNFVYFYFFHGIKNTVNVGKQSPLKDLFFACLAGSVNVLTTNPIWVVNSRMKMSGIEKDSARYSNLIHGLYKICALEGVATLWNGTKASLMLVSNPAIKFTVYEFLKRKVQSVGPIGAFSAFVLGVLSSAVATVVTYPLQMLQAKQRFRGGRQNLKEILIEIVRADGLKGVYRGLDSKLLQSVVAAGFMFLTYEKIAALIFIILGQKKQLKR